MGFVRKTLGFWVETVLTGWAIAREKGSAGLLLKSVSRQYDDP